MTRRLALAALAAALFLTGCSATSKPIDPATHTATPAASATLPSLARLDVQASCVALVPLVTDAGTVVTELNKHSDGSSIDRKQLDTTVTDLQKLLPVVDASMVSDVEDVLGPLVIIQGLFNGGSDQVIELTAFRDAGLSIGATCAPYAH